MYNDSMQAWVEKLVVPQKWSASHLRELAVPTLLILLSLIGLDQLSKRHMQQTMIFQQDQNDTDLYQGRKDTIFEFGVRKARPKFDDNYLGLHFQYSRNKGAAFSMLSGVDEAIRKPFFHFVTFLAVLLIFFMFVQSLKKSWLLRLAMVLILSGAFGNFIDRLLLGYVIDFIDVEWQIFGWRHDFAVFNVADIAINIGVFLFIGEILREWRESVEELKKNEAKEKQAD